MHATKAKQPSRNWKENSTPAARVTHIRYIRLGQVLAMVPMSASTVWRKVREGSFPTPVKLSERITAWSFEEVADWCGKRGAK